MRRSVDSARLSPTQSPGGSPLRSTPPPGARCGSPSEAAAAARVAQGPGQGNHAAGEINQH